MNISVYIFNLAALPSGTIFLQASIGSKIKQISLIFGQSLDEILTVSSAGRRKIEYICAGIHKKYYEWPF